MAFTVNVPCCGPATMAALRTGLSTSAAVTSRLPLSSVSSATVKAWLPRVGASLTAVMLMRTVATLLVNWPSLTV